MTSTRLLDPALAAVADARGRMLREEVATLVAVLDWCAAHEVTEAEASIHTMTPGLQLGGDGCPWVSEFDAHDLACVLGRSPDSCAAYVGNALELRHRLPRLWARVGGSEVPVWKAFRIAEQTQQLPPAGAAEVDRALAPTAHSCTFAQVERTVTSALTAHCPDEVERRRLAALEHRRFDVHLDHVRSLDGTVEVTGTLDLADAVDLDTAVAGVAAQLGELGCHESWDARRALAVGEIARAQLALDLEVGSTTGRGVTVYAHLRSDSDVVETAGTTVTREQLATWCRAPGTTVTVTPVVDLPGGDPAAAQALAERVAAWLDTDTHVRPAIDLSADLASSGYQPSPTLAEQVDLRDRRCVFPHCNRRRTDRDHIRPYDPGGETRSSNLARLCRAHHRAKTHSTWRYDRPGPGVFAWHSPAGATYTVDRSAEP
ncbi:HNH endonuclease signature motif containing protein [Nocardioides litoris]|uniref:HNH endonuclease signature motif containing protein n=1 Tax=Nocardioides litoris TaxID=1926648 RepID=UPI00111F5208|nr:HNH endonuclease signature motif containing protein [Nocardioides litoris]